MHYFIPKCAKIRGVNTYFMQGGTKISDPVFNLLLFNSYAKGAIKKKYQTS